MSRLYPTIAPYKSHRLKVSDLHTVHVEECGNPQGQPALFVHGGPGGGCASWHRQFFDPQRYRIVLFDQRGCGRSTLHSELRQNTTWDLVADMETIRQTLGIERWLMFGGSWGSTLSLAYAETHPQRVTALVLRGIFLMQPAQIDWLYRYGTSELFPEAWQVFMEHIPPDERSDLLQAYHRRVNSEDAQVRSQAAMQWSLWEASVSKLIPSDELKAHHGAGRFADAFARIETHYFINGGFLDTPDQLLRDADRLADIPGVIVQGRYDALCPVANAWQLAQAWPAGELQIIPDAGHSASEPGTQAALVQATDRFAAG